MLATAAFAASFFTHNPGQADQDTVGNTVLLDNTKLLTKAGVTADDIANIESAIYTKAANTTAKTPGQLNGSIRKDSLKVSSYKYAGKTSMPYYKFVVDLPAVRRTFRATLAGGENHAVDIVHVLCPSQSQLIYGKFECQDPAQ